MNAATITALATAAVGILTAVTALVHALQAKAQVRAHATNAGAHQIVNK